MTEIEIKNYQLKMYFDRIDGLEKILLQHQSKKANKSAARVRAKIEALKSGKNQYRNNTGISGLNGNDYSQ
jgi:hypothetical protein